MKQRKLNEAKEELLRALLLMKYDTKKTLTENQKNIKNPLKEDVGSVAVGSAVGGAALGAAAGGAAVLGGVTAAGVIPSGLSGLALSTGIALLPVGAGTAAIATTLGAAVIGGAAALAVLPLVYWLITKDNGADRVKTLIQMCSTNSNEISKLTRKIDDGTIRGLSDTINDAVNYSTLGFMAGTDEESLFGAFNSLKGGTASDACALINKYNQEYGDLYEDLDSDIDSESEWNQIYRPLRDCIEDSLKDIKKDNKCKEGEVWDEKTNSCVPLVVPPDPNSKWKDCPDFPLTKGCKGEKVKKIQDCLGISSDGKFGSGTEKAISDKGYSTPVTQEIYDKIMANCGGTTTTTTILRPEPSTEYTNQV